ncbi:MAG: 50S ribosomal protein L25 [Chlorobi bacterium]|nr:50S ribosomal protein L25 [Chlorobiota bacterium]
MSELVLKATPRPTGKQAAKRLRRSGMVPGIFYATAMQPIPIAVRPLSLHPLVYTQETHVVRLEIEGHGQVYECILKDVAFDPVSDAIVHFDLYGISADRAVEFEVPVRLVGVPVGVHEQGGLLEQIMHKLTVVCKPTDLPEHLDVDVSPLRIGQSVHVGDISVPGLTIKHTPDVAIAAVVAKRVAEEMPTVQQPSEPELVAQKGKKSEE